jgi:hypothetical protein
MRSGERRGVTGHKIKPSTSRELQPRRGDDSLAPRSIAGKSTRFGALA